jgi:protein-S-isoprenylcysteine O-methyltransferase Ste14
MTDQGEPIPASTARLFDVRRIIGGLFVVYGLLVGAIGVFDSPEQIDKAQGVNINLWAGVGMFVLGALFLLWQWLRPAEVPSGGDSAE